MLYLEMSGYGYSKRLCEDVVNWFVSKHLPRHHLEIEVLHRGLKRECALGYCDVSGRTYNPREFLIELDVNLNRQDYIRTLLHELYHVLQFVKGELKLKSSKKYFRGECVEDLKYFEQPHEIFAFWNEKILYSQYLLERA